MKKLFKCPFCNKNYLSKEALYNHMEDEHEKELCGLPAAQVYFNYRNKYALTKSFGKSVISGKPTKFNLTTERYERFADDNEKKLYREQFRNNMIKKYGKDTLLDDPEQQEKMLSSRRISGKYRWSDGKIFTYTGQYEKNLMEFLDKVMNYKSDEIVAPGPVLEYEFNGKKHHWITDFLIIPYNLIIEVKDGGSNPNNRSMPVYRSKQIAKEKMITNMGTYSYIRLTNNDFSQLLCILAELKMKVVDDNADTPLYRIHEDVFTVYNSINESYDMEVLIDSYRDRLGNILEQYKGLFNIESIEGTIETIDEENMSLLYRIYPNNNCINESIVNRYINGKEVFNRSPVQHFFMGCTSSANGRHQP